MIKIVLITGGFDPLHSGHIEYIKAAKKLGDILIIGLNSDKWLIRKKGNYFMNYEERCAILQNIVGVDSVISFDDSDNTAKDAILKVRKNYPDAYIIFANGGDRTSNNIPEISLRNENVEFVFGVGGENKKNSSSWILESWKNNKTEKPWGYYTVFYNSPFLKLKKLVIHPHACLSMQKHDLREEYWLVEQGKAIVYTSFHSKPKEKECDVVVLEKHDSLKIHKNQWHMLCNYNQDDLHIIEIQHGSACDEDDITRCDIGVY